MGHSACELWSNPWMVFLYMTLTCALSCKNDILALVLSLSQHICKTLSLEKVDARKCVLNFSTDIRLRVLHGAVLPNPVFPISHCFTGSHQDPKFKRCWPSGFVLDHRLIIMTFTFAWKCILSGTLSVLKTSSLLLSTGRVFFMRNFYRWNLFPPWWFHLWNA